MYELKRILQRVFQHVFTKGIAPLHPFIHTGKSKPKRERQEKQNTLQNLSQNRFCDGELETESGMLFSCSVFKINAVSILFNSYFLTAINNLEKKEKKQDSGRLSETGYSLNKITNIKQHLRMKKKTVAE